MPPRPVITDLDRRRLGTLIANAIQVDAARRRYLVDLEHELEDAANVDARDVPCDVVTMNSIVQISDLDRGRRNTYTLVYPDDADAKKNRISVLTPAGAAILGYRVGDVIRWPASKGLLRMRIDKILYQPERAGDFRR